MLAVLAQCAAVPIRGIARISRDLSNRSGCDPTLRRLLESGHKNAMKRDAGI